MSNLTGSGIVIYFDNRNKLIDEKPHEILYLVLVDNNNKYDFPKGTIDKFEKPLNCAIRETKEESSLKVNINFIIEEHSKIFSEGLKMYIANYIEDFKDLDKPIDLNKNVKINKNQQTGFFEHKSFFWDSFDNIKNNFPNYLLEVLEWAKNIKEN